MSDTDQVLWNSCKKQIRYLFSKTLYLSKHRQSNLIINEIRLMQIVLRIIMRVK